MRLVVQRRRELIEHRRQALDEMAVDTKAFIDKVADRADNIVENWCLIKYAQDYGGSARDNAHWATELAAPLNHIARTVITGGSSKNSQAFRSRQVRKGLEQALDIPQGTETIVDIFWGKCHAEQRYARSKKWPEPEYTEERVQAIARAFLGEIPKLVGLMSLNHNEQAIEAYVRELSGT